MELKTTKVYVPTGNARSNFKVSCAEDDEGNYMVCNVVKKEGYFLTQEELESVIGDAFDAARERVHHPDYDYVIEDKDQYIKQILNTKP